MLGPLPSVPQRLSVSPTRYCILLNVNLQEERDKEIDKSNFVHKGTGCTFSFKGDNSCNFLFTFLHTELLQKRGHFLKERDQIFSF